ncbi:MAG: chromate transporter [Clostridia bacterium]|nr:chromate transporter [Clostridia bacterium]
MTLLQLFLAFLKVGAFTFGGAYAAIPLIRETVLSYGWMIDDKLSQMIAVSETTPGPIMVNIATYVGVFKAGFLGALIATFAVILPAFVIILLLVTVLKKFRGNAYVEAALGAVKPCVIGIILAVGVYMTAENVLGLEVGLSSVSFDRSAALIAAAAAAMLTGYKAAFKKRLSPIAVIIVCAGLGMLVYGV